ncbi:MAG: hypothetical protein BJ554DRAFT_2811 [Olpidium bornovanus]|uniref:Uncharacterized protein n=1 Tax=Olpidium bornovanus TaxID=278681 RepID=A0A8H8A0Y9_9FUNG|nr:MAG: hypothetical protein BJ554DRAFT_2811 [Olpidium bornovanus]
MAVGIVGAAGILDGEYCRQNAPARHANFRPVRGGIHRTSKRNAQAEESEWRDVDVSRQNRLGAAYRAQFTEARGAVQEEDRRVRAMWGAQERTRAETALTQGRGRARDETRTQLDVEPMLPRLEATEIRLDPGGIRLLFLGELHRPHEAAIPLQNGDGDDHGYLLFVFFFPGSSSFLSAYRGFPLGRACVRSCGGVRVG